MLTKTKSTPPSPITNCFGEQQLLSSVSIGKKYAYLPDVAGGQIIA
jgi:hypothetical protein